MKTPIPHDNVPEQDALTYRVGRYGDFRETMLARLVDRNAPFAPLNALRTRAADDPTIALIDAFAAVGDVLSFYQERLANEGYLRTASEAQSIAELARLTGYRPKPGVASSVFLSFTVDPASSLELAAGARAQSVPGPGQTAQSFETSDDVWVDGAWNVLKPRLSRPTQAAPDLAQLFLVGTATGLKPNDPLLLVVAGKPVLRRVAAVTVEADRQRTMVALQPSKAAAAVAAPAAAAAVAAKSVTGAAVIVPTLSVESPPVASPPPATPSIIDQTKRLADVAGQAPAATPANSTALSRSASSLFAPSSDAAVALAAGSTATDRSKVFRALAVTALAEAPPLEVHAFRAVTAPGGARALPRTLDAAGRVLPAPQEWDLATPVFGEPGPLVITITTTANTQQMSPAVLMRSAASGAARDIELASEIDYGGASVTVTVKAATGETATVHLSDAVGDVTCTVRRFDSSGLVLEYSFAHQPVALLVAVGSDGQATAIAEGATALLTDLVVTTQNLAGVALKITGNWAVQTGATPIETASVLYLDGVFETITPGTWVAFEAPGDSGDPPPPPVMIAGASTVSRTAYGQTGRATRLALHGDWIDPVKASFARAIRETAVYAGSVKLAVAEEDIVDDVSQAGGVATLELESFAPGLASGRWLIVTGERVDLPGSTAAEVVLLAGAQHLGEASSAAPEPGGAFMPGETVHTVLTFAAPFAYTYKLATVSVLGNVAKATQGESANEILGAGNGALANQAFVLKKPPLTYVSATTPSGATSTLRIYVNGLEWGEVDSLGNQPPDARVFVTRAAPGGSVTVRFGDGVHGARLPTGSDNIRARYRSGIGASGNVDAGAISSLLSRPLGLKAVTNPLPATGGADEDSPDAMRRNVPHGLMSLSRLVGLGDYEDFALTFAGVGKASARRFAGADGPLVHLTIAGAADDALDPQSDLWQSLTAALNDFGDDEHTVELAARVAKLALMSADVAIDPTRLWTDVEPVIRARLLDLFSFTRRRLGQPIHVSEVIAAIQAVTGVAYVDVRLLASVAPPASDADLRAALSAGGVGDIDARLARVAGGESARQLLAAELVYLSAELPDMLVLNKVAR